MASENHRPIEASQRRFWARPLVPILPFHRDEFKWLDPPVWPSLPPEPSLADAAALDTQSRAAPGASAAQESGAAEDKGKPQDASEGPKRSQGAEARPEGKAMPRDTLLSLMNSSLSGPLTPEQQEDLLSGISSDAGFKAVSRRIPPSQFPELVNQNPSVAAELLLRMRTPGSGSLKDYANYEAELMRMELTLQSMEVVNRIVASMDTPTEFVVQYILLCITTCNDIKDKTAQSRQVRLLCLFIQLQLRNKTIHVQDVFVEVQAFCIEFSRIKEAAALFRLLKSLDKE